MRPRISAHNLRIFRRHVITLLRIFAQIIELRPRKNKVVPASNRRRIVRLRIVASDVKFPVLRTRALQVPPVEVQQRRALESTSSPASSGHMSMPSSGFGGNVPPHTFVTVGNTSIIEAQRGRCDRCGLSLPTRDERLADAALISRVLPSAQRPDCLDTTDRCRC